MLNSIFMNQLKRLLPLDNIKWLNNEVTITLQNEDLLNCTFFLKNHFLCQFSSISSISGTDYPERNNRFEISYEILSFHHNRRLRLKTFVNEITSVMSICSIYPSANWWEREIWDMFGVFFHNHPDLRRLLTDYGFQGYPLRKDFPLAGYIEVNYDEKLKRVICQPLELTQEFRSFDFRSPWSFDLNSKLIS